MLDDLDVRQPDEADRPIVDAQQDVRDELTSLIELLDRDEDTWVVTRQLETLLNEQAALEMDTSQLAQRTVGQSPADMSTEDRSELDRIAERQAELENQPARIRWTGRGCDFAAASRATNIGSGCALP